MARLPDLVEGIIPACEPTLLAGLPDAGKTTLIALLTHQIALGSVLGHNVRVPPFVGLIVADRASDDARSKFLREGLDIPLYSFVDDDGGEAELATDALGISAYPLVLQMAVKHFGDQLVPGSLLIADGLSTIVGVEPVGRYLRDVARPMIKLGRWCLRHQITMIALHHAGKPKGDPGQRYIRDQDQILGSVALQGFSATQMHFTQPEVNGTDHYRLSITPHGAPAEAHSFSRRPDGGFEWIERIGDAQAVKPKIVQDYIERIPEEGVQALDVMQWAYQQFGHHKARVYQILGDLKAQGVLLNPRKGMWAKARLQ